MKKKIFLTVFVFNFCATIFGQAPINVSSSCGPFYGQGTYEYAGMNGGKPFYRLFIQQGSVSQGDCSSLLLLIDCDRDAQYYLIWETDRWYWKRERYQCQWEAEFGQCVPAAVDQNGIPLKVASPVYLYSNLNDTPEPPTTGWVALPTKPLAYCDPIINTTLSTSNFSNTSFTIYPNPVDNKSRLTIDLGKPFEEVKISLYSVLGQILAENEYKKVSTIEYATNQPKGLYFLKIKVGEQVITRKVILE